jgi:translation initiation factor eIF-2B subunit beta
MLSNSTRPQVIVGTHILMANGGTIAHTGALNIALAARAHQVPYVVVTELYKLCPLYAFDQVRVRVRVYAFGQSARFL